MKTFVSLLFFVVVLSFASMALAQQPTGGGGQPPAGGHVAQNAPASPAPPAPASAPAGNPAGGPAIPAQPQLEEISRVMKPKKGCVKWVVGAIIGLLATAAIVFFILFLVNGDGKDEAKVVNPPQPAPVQQTQPAPAPAMTSDAVDKTARSSAAEAGLKADVADKKAGEAMGEAERVGQDLSTTKRVVDNLTVAHPALTSDACASELESRWLMPGSPYQRMLKKGWLTPQQVKAKAREQCAK